MDAFTIQTILVGDQGVGKSSLGGQYLHRLFPEDKSRPSFRIENIDGNLVRLFLNHPQPRLFFDMPQAWLMNTLWALVVFDLTKRSSFENIGAFLAQINQHAMPGLVKVLLGNKCDLNDQREVTREEAEEVAAAHGMEYFETTATEHESTSVPFAHVRKKVVAAREALMTSVQRAASAGDVTGIEQAINEQGVGEIDAADNKGCTAMHYAAKNGHSNVIETLIRLGSKAIDTSDHNNWSPLMTAAYYNHVPVVQLLVRLGSKVIDAPSTYGHTSLYLAACDGNGLMIEALIQMGSQAIDTPDDDGWTPLYAAAWNSHVSVIETLVRLGSKAIDTPDDIGCTPLSTAASRGHALAIETLVRLGSKAIDTPENNGCTPLFGEAWRLAARYGHVSVIEALVRLESKAIDTPDMRGRTPLHAAAETGHVSVIEALVRSGSKAIDTSDNEGNTPLKLAAETGQTSVIEALVRLGSTAIDTFNNRGWTPMYSAAYYGQVSGIETLVRLGSKAIDTPNNDGRTPLHAAVETPMHNVQAQSRNHKCCVRTLVMLGANSISTDGLSEEMIEKLSGQVNEDEALGLRYRVYFGESLAHRLLFPTNASNR